MKKQQAADSQLVTKKKELNEVAEDKNWRSYVANEIKGADNWSNDWGFLVSEGNYNLSNECRWVNGNLQR